MPFFTSNGANIHIDVAGNAGAPILFVHGFTLDHRQWAPQREVLAASHRVFRMDLRGHGRSARAVRGYTWTGLAADVQRALVQVGMDRLQPGFLVGHSISADAVLQAALAEPRALKGIVIAAPAVWGWEFSAEWKALLHEMRRHAAAHDLARALETFRADPVFVGVRAQPMLETAVRSMQSSYSGESLLSDEVDSGVPTLERLADCKTPLLVVRSERDRDDFRTAAAEVAARAPRAHVVDIDGAGHFANLEAPRAFDRALQDFFAEHA